jgi:hypothetical protein
LQQNQSARPVVEGDRPARGSAPADDDKSPGQAVVVHFEKSQFFGAGGGVGMRRGPLIRHIFTPQHEGPSPLTYCSVTAGVAFTSRQQRRQRKTQYFGSLSDHISATLSLHSNIHVSGKRPRRSTHRGLSYHTPRILQQFRQRPRMPSNPAPHGGRAP